MKRKLLRLMAFLLLALMLPVSAFADCGPKESTEINIMGLDGEYYVTLLSTVKEYGPNSVCTEFDLPDRLSGVIPNPERDAWYAFCNHGLENVYFWGEIRACEGESTARWGYYPPDEFRVAIYVPQTQELMVSEGIYDRYAFSSGYKLDLSKADEGDDGMVQMPLSRDYGLGEEVLGFAVRLLFTLAVELLLALVFYRKKEQLLVILVVNVCTQVGLNVLLGVTNYLMGPWSAIGNLLWGELVVLLVEAVIYEKKLPKYGGAPGRAVGYAIAANLLSCILGIRMLF